MTQLIQKNKSLGRGLASLLGEDDTVDGHEDVKDSTIKTIDINDLCPGKYQPRHTFDDEELDSLIASIEEKGVLQPILVRKVENAIANFEIIAGERRWRAAQQAGLHSVPVIIKDFNDLEALEVGLIENIQRQNLSVLEEAEGYKRLIDEFNHTQEVLAKSLGKSRSHITNTLRLLTLPKSVQSLLDNKAITAGHARALIKCEGADKIADIIVRKGLNVRQTEDLVKKFQNPKTQDQQQKITHLDSEITSLEDALSTSLDLKVSVKMNNNKGKIIINFSNIEEMDSLLEKIGQ